MWFLGFEVWWLTGVTCCWTWADCEVRLELSYVFYYLIMACGSTDTLENLILS